MRTPQLGGNAASNGQHAVTFMSKPAGAMPPPSQPSLSGGVLGSVMTSIREERESSQP